MKNRNEPGIPQWPPIRRTVIAGSLTLSLGLGSFVAWSATAPLEGGAIAFGQVTVETDRKTVQHLSGGIISEILVREGERVERGEALIRLESVESRAEVEGLERQWLQSVVREARLTALIAGEAVLTREVLAIALGDARLESLQRMEREIFDSERQTYIEQIAGFNQRIKQQQALIESYSRRSAARAEEIELVRQQLADLKKLVGKGLVPRREIRSLQREEAALAGAQAETDGRVAAARESIAEAQMQISVLRESRLKEWSRQLSQVREGRALYEERLIAAQAKLRRHEIVAPQAGIVMNLVYVTSGGVIAPGAPIMDIVPVDDDLTIDVRVRPTDIDAVGVGQPARIRLLAFRQRMAPVLTGEVIRVSPDAVTDRNGDAPYFRARIRVAKHQLERLNGSDGRMTPGMPVEAILVQHEQTLLSYLLSPVKDAVFRSFRD